MAESRTRSQKSASSGFTDEVRAAMQQRAREVKARRGPGADAADGESEVLARIAEMSEPDRTMAERLHAVSKASAPTLLPKTWYGMPAYARGNDGMPAYARGNDIICFFQPAQKFKTQYATLGFSDKAKLDEGGIWPIYWALQKLTATHEARIGELVKKAMS